MFLHLWPWHRKADKHDERMREFEIVYTVRLLLGAAILRIIMSIYCTKKTQKGMCTHFFIYLS